MKEDQFEPPDPEVSARLTAANVSEGQAAAGVLSVADIVQRLRHAAERISTAVWICGEVQGLRRAASGHLYFTLKDEREDAILEAVMYRFAAQRATRFLLDGARVQLSGKATVWAPRGRLQFIAERVRPQGRGALLEALERLKAKLHDEGLFDSDRKRLLPESPRVVGVITSLHGAAFHDICVVVARRSRVKIVISPAVVQGEQAPLSLIRAFDLLERHPEVELIIVGRGGGSSEDLMAFNDERVVRRVAQVRVPVISAVGHEIDTTLTDLVADRRAATPSQAAEIAVPDAARHADRLRQTLHALVRSMRSRLSEDRAVATRLGAKLVDPRFVIAERQQYLDDLTFGIERRMRRELAMLRTRTQELHDRLGRRHPRLVLGRAAARLRPLHARLSQAMVKKISAQSALLGGLAASLHALSPLNVLGRGYSLTFGPDGRLVRDARMLTPGQQVMVRFHQGAAWASIQEIVGGTEASGALSGPERDT